MLVEMKRSTGELKYDVGYPVCWSSSDIWDTCCYGDGDARYL